MPRSPRTRHLQRQGKKFGHIISTIAANSCMTAGTMFAGKEAGLNPLPCKFQAAHAGTGCKPYAADNAVV